MGDKSPQNQIKIGNLTVKLNPNNQQKNRRESNYDRNYHRSNDRNYINNDRYNERHNEREREKDRERNRYQNDKNYNNKKNNEDNRYSNKRKDYDYDDRRDKHNKNYKNKSNSNSRSGSKHKHSHTRNHHSRSRSRTHSHHNNQNRNKNYVNEQKNNNSNNNYNSNNNTNNNINNNNSNDSQNKNNNNSLNNNMANKNNNNNMGYMNQMNQNFFNNYINSEFFKKFYQINQLKNNNTNNIIVPIGIPVNYFFNPNLNNMNQMNKPNNINNQTNNNSQNNNQTQNQNKAQKEEPSNTILITDLDTNITKETLEEIFRDKCIKLQVSMPIDIRLVEALNIAYIIFPSVTSCVIVYNSLINQKILINGKYFPIQFSPNLTQKYSNNRDTLTYVTQISSNTSLTTSMETTVHEDWYCVYCDSKNFSRRTVCFKCQKPKSINCRVVPVIKQKKIILGANGEILPNNSIIIQGKQIQSSNEGEVFILLLI